MNTISEETTKLATTEEVCAFFSLSPGTLAALRQKGSIPFLRISQRVIRYDLSEVKKALAGNNGRGDGRN